MIGLFVLLLVNLLIPNGESRVISKRSSSSHSGSHEASNRAIRFTKREEEVFKKLLDRNPDLQNMQQVLQDLDQLDRDFSVKIERTYFDLTHKAKALFDEIFPVFWRFLRIRSQHPEREESEIEAELGFDRAKWESRFNKYHAKDRDSFQKIYSIFYYHQFLSHHSHGSHSHDSDSHDR